MAHRKKHHTLTIPVFSPYNSINFSMADFLGPHRCKQAKSEKNRYRHHFNFPRESRAVFKSLVFWNVYSCFRMLKNTRYRVQVCFIRQLLKAFIVFSPNLKSLIKSLSNNYGNDHRVFTWEKRFSSPRISLGHQHGRQWWTWRHLKHFIYLQLVSANGGANSSPRTENVIAKKENKQWRSLVYGTFKCLFLKCL